MTPDIEFMKLHGCANSFLVSQDTGVAIDWEKASRRLLNRDIGVGADGVLLVRSVEPNCFDFRIYNQDGSDGGMTGNGARCVAWYIRSKGLIPPSSANVRLRIHGREVLCNFVGDEVEVDMGVPSFEPKAVPISNNTPLIGTPLMVHGKEFPVTAISMGNPHCVIFVPALNNINLEEWGPHFERHDMFPKRTNVEFVESLASNHLRVLVWERGVGRTRACGSGACASVVAGVKQGLCGMETEVEFEGGNLKVNWDDRSGKVYLRGPVEEICEGKISRSLFSNLEMSRT